LAAMSEADRKAQIDKWTADAKKHWTVEKGELVNDGHGAYLTTDKEFGDIELLIDYKTVPKADSGIYLRLTPQVQIWDFTKEGGKWDRGADQGRGERGPAGPKKGRAACPKIPPIPPGRIRWCGQTSRSANGTTFALSK